MQHLLCTISTIMVLTLSLPNLYSQTPKTVKETTIVIDSNGDSVVTERITSYEEVATEVPKNLIAMNPLVFLAILNGSYNTGISENVSLGFGVRYSNLEQQFYGAAIETRIYLGEHSFKGFYVAPNINAIKYKQRVISSIGMLFGLQRYNDNSFAIGYAIGFDTWFSLYDRTITLPMIRFDIGYAW